MFFWSFLNISTRFCKVYPARECTSFTGSNQDSFFKLKLVSLKQVFLIILECSYLFFYMIHGSECTHFTKSRHHLTPHKEKLTSFKRIKMFRLLVWTKGVVVWPNKFKVFEGFWIFHTFFNYIFFGRDSIGFTESSHQPSFLR